MTGPTQRAISRYRRELANSLAHAPEDARDDALEDADEFLSDAAHALDAGRLASEAAAYESFVEQFGTPDQLAATYAATSTTEPTGAVVQRWYTPFQCTRPQRHSQFADWFVGVAAIAAMFVVAVGNGATQEPPKVSPFTRVTFTGEKVYVTYDGERYHWLGLDGLDVDAIVDSAKDQFGQRWQKRVAEDLVEVLWGMGHQPKGSVELRLQKAGATTERVVSAEMTQANRYLIYRERNGEPIRRTNPPPTRSELDAPPKLSPFTEVDFPDSGQIEVVFEGNRYHWKALDEIPIEKIESAAKQQFGGLWQKRVAEDLVEVLWGMGHRPEKTVRLELVAVESGETTTVSAPTTLKNRWSVWDKRRSMEVDQ